MINDFDPGLKVKTLSWMVGKLVYFLAHPTRVSTHPPSLHRAEPSACGPCSAVALAALAVFAPAVSSPTVGLIGFIIFLAHPISHICTSAEPSAHGSVIMCGRCVCARCIYARCVCARCGCARYACARCVCACCICARCVCALLMDVL